jgi:hypothetical protein
VAEPRRTFGPTVALGAAAGILLAMSGTERWLSVDLPGPDALAEITYTDSVGVVPAANALALAGLACWGVLLVTRGRFRRAVSGLGLLTGLAQVATVVHSFLTLPDDVDATWGQLPSGTDDFDSAWTGWFWVGAVAAVAGLLAWLAAVRFVRHWPEMGRRYDTPVNSAPEDLWKVLDEGRDPTS